MSIWVWISEVTPLVKLSFVAEVVNPVILLIFAAFAVIAVFPNLSEVALNWPSTVTASEVNVNRSVLAVTPMLEPLTRTFPASRVAAVTLPVVVIAVVISIPSNEPVNLPAPK